MSAADRRQMAVMAAVGIPLTALSAYLQYTHNIMPAADGSLWCGQADIRRFVHAPVVCHVA